MLVVSLILIEKQYKILQNSKTVMIFLLRVFYYEFFIGSLLFSQSWEKYYKFPCRFWDN